MRFPLNPSVLFLAMRRVVYVGESFYANAPLTFRRKIEEWCYERYARGKISAGMVRFFTHAALSVSGMSVVGWSKDRTRKQAPRSKKNAGMGHNQRDVDLNGHLVAMDLLYKTARNLAQPTLLFFPLTNTVLSTLLHLINPAFLQGKH